MPAAMPQLLGGGSRAALTMQSPSGPGSHGVKLMKSRDLAQLIAPAVGLNPTVPDDAGEGGALQRERPERTLPVNAERHTWANRGTTKQRTALVADDRRAMTNS